MSGFLLGAHPGEASRRSLHCSYLVCSCHPSRRALQVADPARHLPDSLGTLLNPVGSVGDKINVGWYRLKSAKGTLDTVLTNPETTTLKALQVSCPCLEALLSIAGLLTVWPERGNACHAAAWGVRNFEEEQPVSQLCT